MNHLHRIALFKVLLLLLRGYLLAQNAETPEPLAAPQSDTYVGKAFSEAKRQICFELPDGLVDWEDLAKATLGKRRFAHPNRSALRNTYPEVSTQQRLQFRVPVPLAVSKRVWWILHWDGAFILQPAALRGEVTYDFDEASHLREEPYSSGTACGVVSGPRVRAGFVVGGVVENWSSEPVKWFSDPKGRLFIRTPVGRYTLKPPDFAIPRIDNVRLFRPKGLRPRVFVVWSSNPRDWPHFYCVSAFSIYELRADGNAEMIGENGYACDL